MRSRSIAKKLKKSTKQIIFFQQKSTKQIIFFQKKSKVQAAAQEMENRRSQGKLSDGMDIAAGKNYSNEQTRLLEQFNEKDSRLQKLYCDALAIFLEYEDYQQVIESDARLATVIDHIVRRLPASD
jgi:hypothetical protein